MNICTYDDMVDADHNLSIEIITIIIIIIE